MKSGELIISWHCAFKTICSSVYEYSWTQYFLVWFLSLFIIHPHQQLESHFFVKHLQSDANSLWKLEATVDNWPVLEVVKSCNDQEKLSSSNRFAQASSQHSILRSRHFFCRSLNIVALSGTGHHLRPLKPTTTPNPLTLLSSNTGADFYPHYRLRASYRRQA